MKDVIIKKGRHFSNMSVFPILISGKDRIAYNVIFTPSCAYDIGLADQLDVNKLFGIGYFPSHHKNSVRFGWRYDPRMEAIELLAYYYADGKRDWQHVCYATINEELTCIIDITEDGHFLVVYNNYMKLGEVILDKPIGRDFGYRLKPFFGGNQKAPHDIWIRMKKLD